MNKFIAFIPIMHTFDWIENVEFRTIVLSSESLYSLKDSARSIFLKDSSESWIANICIDECCSLDGYDNIILLIEGVEDKLMTVQFKVFLREIFRKHNDSFFEARKNPNMVS